MLYEIQDVIYNLFLRVFKRRTFFYQNSIFIRRGKEVRHHSRKKRIVFKIVRKGKKKPGSSGYCSQGRRGGPQVPSFEGSALRWIRIRIIITGKSIYLEEQPIRHPRIFPNWMCCETEPAAASDHCPLSKGENHSCCKRRRNVSLWPP